MVDAMRSPSSGCELAALGREGRAKAMLETSARPGVAKRTAWGEAPHGARPRPVAAQTRRIAHPSARDCGITHLAFSRFRSVPPSAGLALVRPAEERGRGAQEDLQVEPRGAVLDVPDVQLDALCPRQPGAAVDLGPAGDAGLDLQPPALASRVLLDLVAQGRPRADDAHVPAHHVPELGELVDGEPAEQPADSGDARVSLVDGEAGAHRLGTDDHRAQLEQVEVDAIPAHASLAVEDGAAVLQLDRDRKSTRLNSSHGSISYAVF